MAVQMLLLLSVFSSLLATALSDEDFVEQSLPYVVVTKEDLPLNLTCTLKMDSYSWLSWYVQDLQGQLHFLETTRETGDKEKATWEGSSYVVERVNEMHLKLEVKAVSESQTLYCTCSEHHSGRRRKELATNSSPCLPSSRCSSENGRTGQRCRRRSQA